MKRLFALLFSLLLVFTIPMTSLAGKKEDNYAKTLTYWLEVDLTHCLVIARSTRDNSIVRTMICSPGLGEFATPPGVFYLPQKENSDERGQWMNLAKYNSWVRFATRINGPILFHSINYGKKSIKTISKKDWAALGSPASHGCIRLTPRDAYWISMNCPVGTKVNIHKVKKSEERASTRDEIRQSLPPISVMGTVGEFEPPVLSEENPFERITENESYVKTVQLRLREIGFFPDKADGKFGENTALALMSFQEAMGYTPTGLLDAVTMEILFDPDPAIGAYVTIKREDESLVVSALQKKLAEENYYHGEISGIYEKALKEAIDQFCKDYGIAPISGTDITPAMQLRIFSTGVQKPQRTANPAHLAPLEDEEDVEASGEAEPGDVMQIILDKAGSTLNLRETESKESAVLATIPHEEYVTIIEAGEVYHKVLYEGIEGYASAKYMYPDFGS